MKQPAILVIRQYDRFSEALERDGFEVVNLELIRTEPLGEAAMPHRLNIYDGLFFTSPAAADVFINSGREFFGSVYVLGERSKKILDAAGIKNIYRESANTAGELIGSFDPAEFAGKRLLYLCGDRSMRAIPRLLANTADVDEAVVYRTVSLSPDAETVREIGHRLDSGEIGWICFFSPSGVEGFVGSFVSGGEKNAKAAAIGETTAKAAEAAGLNVKLVSSRANGEIFAKELSEHIKRID